jgi:hypothetical protein
VEIVRGVEWDQIDEDKAKAYEVQYLASMNATSTLLKMAQKFLAEKRQECARLATNQQRQEITGMLTELQKLETSMENEKRAAAKGVIKARVWAELAQIKLKVSSAAEQGTQLAERLSSTAQGDISAEKMSEIDGLQQELTATFSRLSEVKVAIAKHMKGASPTARQELTEQLASATQAETSLRTSKTAAMAFSQEGKETVLIAECQALVDKTIEKYMPMADQVEVDKLSLEEAKARLATIHSQQKAAAAEIKGMREDIMKMMQSARGEAKKKMGEISTKAGTISQKLDAEMQAAVKAISTAEQRAATPTCANR